VKREDLDFKIESPDGGREMNMRLMGQFYERVEVETENNRNMFSPIRLCFDTTENKNGFHKVYITQACDYEESREILEMSGVYFNPSLAIGFDELKELSDNGELYLHAIN
jgi:hypothetical protein